MEKMNIEPGLFEIAIDDYHRDPCPEPSLNASLIPWLLQCPAKAKARHPKLSTGFSSEESRRMDLGSVAHKLLLGRGRDIKVIDADNYRTKAAQEARDAARAAGVIPVLASDLATAEAMHTAAVKQLEDFDLDHGIFEGGKAELAMFWKDAAGCWGRSLIDYLYDNIPTWHVWDYKTTERCVRPEDAAMGAFIVDQGYDMQLAVQERGLLTLFPSLSGRLKFRLLFQETEEPYLISVVEPDESTMAIARRKVDYAMHLWAECLRAESFPGYTPEVVKTEHAGYLADRWIKREIDETYAAASDALPDPSEPVKRGPGRPLGSKNVPKKRLMFEMRQRRAEERQREREKLDLPPGQNPLEGG
jgi:hypothetical protein